MTGPNKIFIAGHKGMVGSAIVRALASHGSNNIVTASRNELDLESQADVQAFFADKRINQVYLAAAQVGGIYANATYPADFIYKNLSIQNNVIHSAYLSGIKRLVFLGSSCIYPKFTSQPIREESLLTAALEPTNESYAIAKIAGIKMCEAYRSQHGCDFRSLMPTNLYGPNDNFHPEHSHVIPGLLARFHVARMNADKAITVWGTGKPRREFLHVDDLASACVHAMEIPESTWIAATKSVSNMMNVGTGMDCSIAELADLISDTTGFNGKIVFDSTKPDGTPQKLLDVSRIEKSGWRYKTGLESGLASTYDWYKENLERVRS